MDADVGEFAAEQGLVVFLVGNNANGLGMARARVDMDLMVGSDHAGAKDDRRNVALARGSQTHDEPHRLPSGKVAA